MALVVNMYEFRNIGWFTKNPRSRSWSKQYNDVAGKEVELEKFLELFVSGLLAHKADLPVRYAVVYLFFRDRKESLKNKFLEVNNRLYKDILQAAQNRVFQEIAEKQKSKLKQIAILTMEKDLAVARLTCSGRLNSLDKFQCSTITELPLSQMDSTRIKTEKQTFDAQISAIKSQMKTIKKEVEASLEEYLNKAKVDYLTELGKFVWDFHHEAKAIEEKRIAAEERKRIAAQKKAEKERQLVLKAKEEEKERRKLERKALREAAKRSKAVVID